MKWMILLFSLLLPSMASGATYPNYYVTNPNPAISVAGSNAVVQIVLTNAALTNSFGASMTNTINNVTSTNSILVNISIPFTLISGTVDMVSTNLPDMAIGWKLVAWNYYVDSTPAIWSGDVGSIGMYLYYDIEDNTGLADQVEIHSGDLVAGIPSVPAPSQTGLSLPMPIFFKHAHNAPNNCLFAISWDTVPAAGESVAGFIRLLVKKESPN